MNRAIEIRNMNTGVHELYLLKPKVNAKRVLSWFRNLGGSVSIIEFTWSQISKHTSEVVEVNYRNYSVNKSGNKYFLVNGEKWFVMNQNHIDVW